MVARRESQRLMTPAWTSGLLSAIAEAVAKMVLSRSKNAAMWLSSASAWRFFPGKGGFGVSMFSLRVDIIGTFSWCGCNIAIHRIGITPSFPQIQMGHVHSLQGIFTLEE